jgi:hypothetical protein
LCWERFAGRKTRPCRPCEAGAPEKATIQLLAPASRLLVAGCDFPSGGITVATRNGERKYPPAVDFEGPEVPMTELCKGARQKSV